MTVPERTISTIRAFIHTSSFLAIVVIVDGTPQVVARGSVILVQHMPVNGDLATITFTATSQMAPKAMLVAYAVRSSNQEILVDATNFRVDGLFQNNVSFTVDRTTAEPGSTVKYTVKADPKSYCALLAVDQSVLLLKSGNDITKDLVEQDMEQYDTTVAGRDFRPWEADVLRQRRSIWYPWWGIGGKDAATILKNSGLVVLTDALLFRGIYNEDEVDGCLTLRSNVAYNLPKIRKFFPETWIWNNMQTR
ncbi:unnamed protein product, partial [Litomosoides sigmodontis]